MRSIKLVIALYIVAMVWALSSDARVMRPSHRHVTMTTTATTTTTTQPSWTDPNKYTALWEFETTNTVATLDTSGNTFHATNYPSVATGPTWVIAGTNQNGRSEYCYSFDGSSDAFFAERSIPLLQIYPQTTAFVVGFWVWKSGNVVNYSRYLTQDGGGRDQWYVRDYAGNDIQFVTYDGGNIRNSYTSGGWLTTGVWHFVSCFAGATNQTIFVDASNSLQIGGNILDLQIFDTVWIASSSVPDYHPAVKLDHVFFLYTNTWTQVNHTNLMAYTCPTNNTRSRP